MGWQGTVALGVAAARWGGFKKVRQAPELQPFPLHGCDDELSRGEASEDNGQLWKEARRNGGHKTKY